MSVRKLCRFDINLLDETPMPATAAPPVQQSNPQQIALALKTVIESVYTDGISAVLKTTQASDGTITGKFADGPQVYDFSISPDNKITYNETEATGGRSDAYLIGYTMDSGFGLKGERLDAPVATPGQKMPKCEKGKRCGGGCVQQGLACRQTLSPQASQAMVSIRSAIASHPAVAKANAEVSQKVNQPTQPQKETSSTVPFYQDSKYRSDLLKAGLTTAAVTAVVGGAIHTIQSDLDKSQVDFKAIRQPPGGIPDKETLDYYDTLKPGDLVRKAFTAPGWGARHHYGVYVGKNPETGEHMMIEATNNLKSKDKTPTVQKNPLTRGVGANATQYERVPTENMYRDGTHKMSSDEIVKRAESMLGKTFAYKGFESNCESLARAIVEGKSYSAQGDGVSGFTNVVSGFVTDNASKVKVGKGEKGEGGIRLGSFVIRKTEYGKDKNRMTSAQIADYLNKQVATRKDADSASEKPSKASASSATGIADEFFNAAGIQSPKDYEASVELVAQKFPAMADAIRAEMYKKYLLMLFSSTAKGADKKKDSARLDADKGKPCGKGHIASNLKCSIGTSAAPASQALEFDPVFERKLKDSGMNSRVVGNVLSGVLGGLTVAGVGVGAAIVAKDFKNASEAVPFDSIRQPPGGVPDEQTRKTYEAFQVGDVIRKNFKVPGGAWQHYAVYMGKDSKTGEQKIVEVGHSFKDGAIDMKVRTSNILDDADEESTDFEKVPDKELYPGKTKPFTSKEIAARAQALVGRKFSYQGFESNCESFARGIVTGIPTATQRERISAFSNAVSMLTTEAALRVKKTEKGLALSDYNGHKERMTAAEMIQWLERDKENRRADAADSPLLPLPSVYASAVEVLAQKFPALADNIRVDLYKRYFLAMFALSSPNERTDSLDAAKKDSVEGSKPQLQKFVAALLKPAIRQVYSDVSQVANVDLKGAGVTGVFTDSNGDAFQFEISAGGRLTYKAATRKDAEQDQCEKGMQCGSSCVPQGDQCNSGLSASGQAIAQLAVKTLKTEELPSRLEVARAMGIATKGFLRNPVKALKEGVQREAAVRESIKAQTGVIVPSQTEILKKAGQKMTGFVKDSIKKNAEDGAVNTAGLAASIVGGAVAGPIGALAGDLGGALATRKAITDYKALQRAKSKLADDEAFKSAGALSKLKRLGAATLAELKSAEMQKKIEDDATGDVAGWAIGNASAVALTAMGVNIPLKGAVVAIATTPSVVKAHRRIREGEAAGKVIREAARDLASLPKNVISRGEDREKAARQEATRKIQRLKAAVATTAVATTAAVGGVVAVRNLRNKD